MIPSSTFAFPPQLDHVFVTVDAQTQKAINECRFLTDETLGRFLIRESESNLLGRYEPTRVFGESTLVEIFPHAFGGNDTFKGVAAGVVLSFDRVGHTALARQQLQDCGISFDAQQVERIGRSSSGELTQLPWYLFTRPDMGANSRAALFFHELTPAYFDRIGATPDAQGRQNRSTHFNAALRRPHTPDHLMQDIVGVSIRLGQTHIDHAASILRSLGWVQQQHGPATRLVGPTGEITLLPDDTSSAQVDLKIRLTRPVPHQRFDFGPSSSLVLSPLGDGDASAVWTFVPPSQTMPMA